MLLTVVRIDAVEKVLMWNDCLSVIRYKVLFSYLQVICLYPKFLSSNSSFTRCAPPLHEIADINQLCRGNEDLIMQYKDFLCSYLEEIKGTKLAVGYKQVHVFFVLHIKL